MRWQGYTLIAQVLDCQVLANGLELFPCVLVVVVLAPASLHTLQRLLMGVETTPRQPQQSVFAAVAKARESHHLTSRTGCGRTASGDRLGMRRYSFSMSWHRPTIAAADVGPSPVLSSPYATRWRFR